MKTSQENLILDHLQSGKTLSPLEALHLFNCLALSSRISDLHKKGYPIKTTFENNNGKTYARYSYEYKIEPSGQLSLI